MKGHVGWRILITLQPLMAFFRCGYKGKMYFRLVEQMGVDVIAIAFDFSRESLSCTITDTVYLIGNISKLQGTELEGWLRPKEVLESVATVRNLVIRVVNHQLLPEIIWKINKYVNIIKRSMTSFLYDIYHLLIFPFFIPFPHRFWVIRTSNINGNTPKSNIYPPKAIVTLPKMILGFQSL